MAALLFMSTPRDSFNARTRAGGEPGPVGIAGHAFEVRCVAGSDNPWEGFIRPKGEPYTCVAHFECATRRDLARVMHAEAQRLLEQQRSTQAG
jgi:hypothetical protein